MIVVIQGKIDCEKILEGDRFCWNHIEEDPCTIGITKEEYEKELAIKRFDL